MHWAGKDHVRLASARLARLLNDDSKLIAFPPGGGIGTSYYLSDRVLVALQETDGESEAVVAAIVKLLEKIGAQFGVGEYVALRAGTVSAVPALEGAARRSRAAPGGGGGVACIAPERDGLHKVFQEALADRDSMEYLLAARGFGDLRSRAAPILPQLLEELDRLSDPDAKAIVAAAIVKIDKRQTRAVVELAHGLRDAPELFRFIGHDDATAAWVALGTDAQPGTELLVSGLRYEVTDPTVRVFDKIRQEANIRLRSAELLIDISLRTPEAAAGLIELCQSQDCVARRGSGRLRQARTGRYSSRAGTCGDAAGRRVVPSWRRFLWQWRDAQLSRRARGPGAGGYRRTGDSCLRAR